MKLLVSWIDKANAVMRCAAGIMLGMMVVVVAIQICVRFVLPVAGIVVSAPWSEEIARYLLIWTVFIGAAVSARYGNLISVEAFPNAMSHQWGLRIRVIAIFITIGFLLGLVWLGCRWVTFGASETSTVLSLPMGWVYAAMPVGSALMIMNLLALVIEGDPQKIHPQSDDGLP